MTPVVVVVDPEFVAVSQSSVVAEVVEVLLVYLMVAHNRREVVINHRGRVCRVVE